MSFLSVPCASDGGAAASPWEEIRKHTSMHNQSTGPNTRTILSSCIEAGGKKEIEISRWRISSPLSRIDHARHASPVMPEADHYFSVDRLAVSVILTRRCADQILQARARAIDL